jgi:hypothetical protein
MKPFNLTCPERIGWATAGILALNLALGVAHAGEWQVLIGSRHIGDTPQSLERDGIRHLEQRTGWQSTGTYIVGHYAPPKYCEANPGLGYTNDDRWGVLVYHNSECGISVAAGRETPRWHGLSASAGLVTGYEGGAVLPFLAAHYTRGHLRVTAMPYVTHEAVGMRLPETGQEAQVIMRGAGVAVALGFVF